MPNGIEESATKLAKHGNTGVAIFALIVLFASTYMFFNSMANHIDKSTEAQLKGIEVQQKLIDVIDDLEETIKSPAGQANLNNFTAQINSAIMEKQYRVEYDPRINIATTTAP